MQNAATTCVDVQADKRKLQARATAHMVNSAWEEVENAEAPPQDP